MNFANSLEIPQDILDAARMSIDDLKTEIAISLYARGRLSGGKARELAGMSLWEFRQLISYRGIPVHYDTSDLKDDLATSRELRRS